MTKQELRMHIAEFWRGEMDTGGEKLENANYRMCDACYNCVYLDKENKCMSQRWCKWHYEYVDTDQVCDNFRGYTV
jgi:hypothetical protein